MRGLSGRDHPGTGGLISFSWLPAFRRGARQAVGCEMVWFCFIGVVQPSPNQGPRFQGGMTRGLCFEHLCGTTARKASFPAVLREIYLFIYLSQGGSFLSSTKICWLEP